MELSPRFLAEVLASAAFWDTEADEGGVRSSSGAGRRDGGAAGRRDGGAAAILWPPQFPGPRQPNRRERFLSHGVEE